MATVPKTGGAPVSTVKDTTTEKAEKSTAAEVRIAATAGELAKDKERELGALQKELTERRTLEGALAKLRPAAQLQGEIDVALRALKELRAEAGK